MLRKLFLHSMVLFVLLCLSLVSSAEAASMWSKTYGASGENVAVAYSVVEASDGGYVMAGSAGFMDYYLASQQWISLLVKTDALGNMQWSRTYGNTDYFPAGASLVATSDGGYAMAAGNMLLKTDALGIMQWNRTYEGLARSLVITSDGGFAIAGTANNDFWLAKTDALGNMQWNKTYGGTGEDVACSVIATSDGGYALAGVWNCSYDGWYSFGVFLGGDAWLVKTDASGNMEWNRTYGGPGDGWASSVIETSDGGYAIAGTFNYTEFYFADAFSPGSDFWLIKTDALGNMEWNRTYGGEGDNLAYSLVATADGGYAIAGSLNVSVPGLGTADAWLVKTDSFGNMLWNQTYGGTGDDYARSLIATSDGGYAIAGISNYSYIGELSTFGPFFLGDCWLIKTDEFGVVPEYSLWLVPTLVLTATAFIIIDKKRPLRRHP